MHRKVFVRQYFAFVRAARQPYLQSSRIIHGKVSDQTNTCYLSNSKMKLTAIGKQAKSMLSELIN